MQPIRSYVVRIYRQDRRSVAGVVEDVRTGKSRFFHSLENLLAGIPGTRRVELLPNRTAERLVDIFDRRRRHRRQHLQRTTSFGRLCDRHLATGKERFFAARRGVGRLL